MTTNQPPAGASDAAIAGWIADGDTIPADLIDVTRDAICMEFGNNGTDGYYKRILVKIFAALTSKADGESIDIATTSHREGCSLSRCPNAFASCGCQATPPAPVAGSGGLPYAASLAKWCDVQADDPDNKDGAVTLLAIAETLRAAAKALAPPACAGDQGDEMSALTRAREYLATLEGDGRTRHAGHPDSILAELVAEIESAPVVKVRGKTGEFATIVVSHDMIGQTVRLLAEGGRDGGC